MPWVQMIDMNRSLQLSLHPNCHGVHIYFSSNFGFGVRTLLSVFVSLSLCIYIPTSSLLIVILGN